MLFNSDIKTYAIAGYATGPVAIAGDGTVFQSTAAGTFDSAADIYTYSTSVAVLGDTGFVTLANAVSGLPIGSSQTAADGGLYQAIAVFDTDTGSTTTSIAKITGTGLTTLFEGLTGTPFGADGNMLPVVVGPGGTLYQTTVGDQDPDTGAVTTYVATRLPDGSVDTTAVPGQAVGAIVTGPNGVAYQTTYDPTNGTTPIAMITSAGTTVYTFHGSPANGVAVIAPDGNAYQTVTANDPVTGEYTALVAVLSPSDVEAPAYKGAASGPAVVGADGTVYQTVNQFDIATQTTYTIVLAVDAFGLTPVGDPIVGKAEGSVVIGADGVLYQTVYTEGGAGQYFTAVHAIDPGAGGNAAAAKSAAVAAVQSGPTITATIPVGDAPDGVAVSPNSNYRLCHQCGQQHRVA